MAAVVRLVIRIEQAGSYPDPAISADEDSRWAAPSTMAMNRSAGNRMVAGPWRSYFLIVHVALQGVQAMVKSSSASQRTTSHSESKL